ncbi:MAG: alpha/beta hydrolase [Candidatus Hermodarchaeota archaeon]
MLSKNVKRFIVVYFGIIISTLIWNINQNVFGNPFWPCFILSTTTFLIIYTPFEIYFSFRDLWFNRWIQFRLDDLNVKKVKINVDNGKKKKKRSLVALLITSNNDNCINSKNTVIVVCHGFSDKKETLQFYYLPLAMQGFTILAYDARGTGESRKLGRRNQFYKRIEDYKTIIKWIKEEDDLKNKKIFSIGFSIGALTILCGGFPNSEIEKLVAISSISDYKQNLPRFNPIILIRYFFKGVKLFPTDEENEKLSPFIVMNKIKQTLPEEEWKILSKRVLLIHCRNDKIIKLRNFEENSKLLNISEQNKLVLRKGGHANKKDELVLVGASLRFFNS